MRGKKREIDKIVEFLTRRKGYYSNGKLRKGRKWLSRQLNVSVEDLLLAVEELNAHKEQSPREPERKYYVTKEPVAEDRPSSKISITTPGTYWVTGCAHAPWHNKAMYDSVYRYIGNELDTLQGIVLAGDIVDLNSLSFHDRGNVALPGVNLEFEYREANKFLDEIDALSPRSETVYIYGNHEDRYNRILNNADASKYGAALKSPIEGLLMKERGYQVMTNWKTSHVNIGRHLEINHGEFFNVHTAKKTIDTYRKSVMYFHTHRFQIYMEGLVAGWNMGAGADFTAPVFNFASRAMKNSWVNGSALVTLDREGFYHVQPLLHIDNKLIVNGKKY